MTNYEFFEQVQQGNITEEVKKHAEEQMAKIREDRVKAAERRSKKADENLPMKNSIYEYLVTSGAKVASEIAEYLTTEENSVSTSKVSSMCRQMEEEGRVTSEKVKSPTSKSKVKQYTAVVNNTPEEAEANEEEEA